AHLVWAIGLGLILISLVKNPATAISHFKDGALGNESRRSDVVMMALPILLCASGLLLTFTSGLWNIGIEGQVTMGAIFTTFLARIVGPQTPGVLVVPFELLLAMLGGAL